MRSDAEIVADGSIVCCGSLAGKVWLMIELGKTLLGLGLLLVVIGGVLVLSGRLGLPIGKLPGDIAYKGKSFSVYIPLGTSILLSIVLSVIFYLLSRFHR